MIAAEVISGGWGLSLNYINRSTFENKVFCGFVVVCLIILQVRSTTISSQCL